MTSYYKLIEQRQYLLSMSFRGLKAARPGLQAIDKQIAECEQNFLIFEPSFVHKKPGFHARLVNALVAQARIGSEACMFELQEYADWVIANRKLVKSASQKKFVYDDSNIRLRLQNLKAKRVSND